MTIKTKPATDEYRNNWDAIFGKKREVAFSKTDDLDHWGYNNTIDSIEVAKAKNKFYRSTLGLIDTTPVKKDSDVQP